MNEQKITLIMVNTTETIKAYNYLKVMRVRLLYTTNRYSNICDNRNYTTVMNHKNIKPRYIRDKRLLYSIYIYALSLARTVYMYTGI